MASDTLKHYDDEMLDIKDFIENHFSCEKICIIEENVMAPIKLLHKLFSSGLVKGDKMLDMSIAGVVYPLFSACNVIKEFYVMNFTDASDKHFKQWLEKCDTATDWSFVSKRVCQLEGNVDGWQEKEEQVRRAIKGVVKYDIFSGCKDSVVLPQVDCVMSVFVFNAICKTKEDITKNLKTLTSWLKIGGSLVLFMALNMSFYRVGKHKFFALKVDAKYVKESVTKAGFIIEKEEVIPTSIEHHTVDYKHLLFIVARKMTNV